MLTGDRMTRLLWARKMAPFGATRSKLGRWMSCSCGARCLFATLRYQRTASGLRSQASKSTLTYGTVIAGTTY